MSKSENSLNRRNFVRNLSGIVIGTAAALGVNAAEKPKGTQAKKNVSRKERCIQLRKDALKRISEIPFPDHMTNGDEERYERKIGNFSKGLAKNELSEVRPESYANMVKAIESGEYSDFEKIGLGGHLKLSNPMAAYSFALEGNDPFQFACAPPPPFASAELAAEMIELYWMSLLRDVPFNQYESHPAVAKAAAELASLNLRNCTNITPASIFRGAPAGELVGPLISQFLWLDVPYGAGSIVQKYKFPHPGIDFMADYQEWLSIQRGYFPKEAMTPSSTLGYIRTGRDLAEWDHRDFSFQGCINAALILLGPAYSQKPQRVPFSARNPYIESLTQSGFCTFGGPFVLDMVGRASSAALRATWTQKWTVHRYLRPEEFGGKVHNHLAKKAVYPIHESLLNSKVLEELRKTQETFLLSQTYPEGSPLHPSYQSGHAVLAGAGVTVLKALFNEDFVLPKPVVPDADGQVLMKYRGASLTIGNELNKLAANIAFGRNFAGIHWRSDAIEGLLLGESAAISVLQDMKPALAESFECFEFTKFDGTKQRI